MSSLVAQVIDTCDDGRATTRYELRRLESSKARRRSHPGTKLGSVAQNCLQMNDQENGDDI